LNFILALCDLPDFRHRARTQNDCHGSLLISNDTTNLERWFQEVKKQGWTRGGHLKKSVGTSSGQALKA